MPLFEVHYSFLNVSEQFSFHVSNHFLESKAQQTKAWLLSVVTVDDFHCLSNGAKTHVLMFWISRANSVSVRYISL